MTIFEITLFDNESFDSFTKALKDKGVPHIVKEQGVSTFSNLVEQQFFGQIEIQETYGPILKLILPQYSSKVAVNKKEIQTKPRYSLKNIAFFSYALIITLLFMKYWDIDRKMSSDKHFEYRWNSFNTVMKSYYHGSEEASGFYYDKNHDNNFERIVEYGTLSPGTVSYYDDNEDGFWDEMTYKNKSRTELYEAWYNDDGDRYFEKSIFILEGTRDTMIFTDKNVNGIWEFQGRAEYKPTTRN